MNGVTDLHLMSLYKTIIKCFRMQQIKFTRTLTDESMGSVRIVGICLKTDPSYLTYHAMSV